MIRPTAVEPRPMFRIWLRYADGVSGEVDLSHLAARGVFEAWKDPGIFESVHIAEHGAVAWTDDIELCPDALYMRLTGKAVEAVMPRARIVTEDA